MAVSALVKLPCGRDRCGLMMAERVGFEPTVPVRVQQFSRLPDSTTLAPLRMRISNTKRLDKKISSSRTPPVTEKFLYELTAFVGEDAGDDIHSVVEIYAIA